MSDRTGERAFWLCHSCGAQMRPIRTDGTPHCASCNSEFIEILDEEINPDPFHDLPPAPPVRPQSSPPIPGNRPQSPHGAGSNPGGSLPGMMGSLFSSLFGGSSDDTAQNEHPHAGQRDTQAQAGAGAGPSGRTYTFNIGGGTGSVTFGSFGGGGGAGGGWGGDGRGGGGMAMGPFGPYNPVGPSGGDQGGGLDAFFPGFPPAAGRRPGGAPGSGQGAGARPGDPNDIMRALMGLLMEEGVMQGPQGRMDMGDYVASQHGFDEVMERLMQAAGPQGPIPATQAVIEGLPRFKLDEQKIEKSPFKDCPVCKDDFVPDDEVMRIPCEHIFHVDCLQPWLKTNGSCPVCRFSLIPDDANGPPRTTQQGAANPGAESGTPGQQPGVSPFTNILNRLWGQSGAAPTSSDAPSSTERTQSPAQPQRVYSPPRSPPPAQQRIYDPPSSPPPSAPAAPTSGRPATDETLPSSIPEDYRARHRQREREQQQEGNPYVDDLD